MFYSHEILTSRKYGVATVWLVATLGAKSSNTKKISRKAILEVNVKKACATIIEPEAPMALRLQSNLLYGVSRVYDQQCGYVLQDAQAAQNALRALIKASLDKQLDVGAGKARRENLLLHDDPAFLTDMPLPAFDFDLEVADISDLRSTQSMMSIRDRSVSISGSSQNASVLGLNLPSSSGNSQYQLPRFDPFGNSPVVKVYETLGRDDEEEFLNNDDLFAFDEDGQLQEVQETEREQLLAGAVPVGHYPSDSAAEARVLRDHEGGLVRDITDRDGDFNMAYGDDDLGILPDDVIPFGEMPLMTGGLGGDDQPQRHSSQDRVHSIEETSSESAEARQVRKRPKKSKSLLADKQLEIKNIDMKTWQHDYLQRMEEIREKDTKQEKDQAKKNAFQFVFGGLNGIGGGIGSSKVPSPLDMFTGESLLALVTGKSLPEPTVKKSKKRKADDDNSTPEPKRLRESDQGRNSIGLDQAITDDEGGYMPMYDDDFSQSIEVGRDAASALQDHPSSALMPWNKSASLHSHNRNLSSQHGRSSQFGGVHNRLGSSPLIGRGSALLEDLDQLMPPDDEDMVIYGREDEDEGSPSVRNYAAGVRIPSPRLEDKRTSRPQLSASQAADEFEIFGQAANVDTQTAASSQWMREALDQESNNFLEYVRNTIEENRDDELAVDDEAVTNSASNKKGDFVTFEGLFDVDTNSHIVAAQAFYHVLCLATKRRVWVEQDSEDGIEPFGEIRIGIAQAI